MSQLQKFKLFAESSMMELEAILSEVYTTRCQNLKDFALFDGGVKSKPDTP